MHLESSYYRASRSSREASRVAYHASRVERCLTSCLASRVASRQRGSLARLGALVRQWDAAVRGKQQQPDRQHEQHRQQQYRQQQYRHTEEVAPLSVYKRRARLRSLIATRGWSTPPWPLSVLLNANTTLSMCMEHGEGWYTSVCILVLGDVL